MKHGFLEKRIHMGVFDYSVICIIGDYKKTEKYVRWKFDDKDFTADDWDMGYVPRGKVFFRRGFVPILWIPRKPKTAREYSTLAHEALHCVYHLFEWANLPMSRDTEEAAAHSMAYIINEILGGKPEKD